ncbi:aldo/keto reductase [Streptomyces azureus]|uniref:Aldo/keto reductase n=1 Tax=Streptomyces azureus TaxID=146537 RepID=A0A0K8PTT8_STRAJ|nr:aldo/keto reductase [Streptomyces azureus]
MTTTTFRIGGDLDVRRLGFGAMHLPTEAGPARENALAVARRAVELGVTLIDTAHLYGGGANEELLAEALHPYPAELLITTKVGVARIEGEWRLDGRPETLRHQVEQALRRLRVERIELLQLHRIAPGAPLADQLGTLRDLPDRGPGRPDRAVGGHRRRAGAGPEDRRHRERAEPLQPARP